MDPRIDNSKWKPRRTRGTPSYRYRHYFALSVLAVAVSTGLYGILSPRFTKYYHIIEPKFRNTQEEIDRKNLMGFLPQKSKEEIEDFMEQQKKILSEK
ncbi:uncharacterized protein LOC129810052 [Phlebotomus papatasi]|uniref:uncharacterized protein LOC129810052 n=1 Tax=Phlebotomus papatasi TaxID=29031 RepID=UPI0024837653|nr:uncharacterized protein LOC129810052 [Phlebotomus papatasi]